MSAPSAGGDDARRPGSGARGDQALQERGHGPGHRLTGPPRLPAVPRRKIPIAVLLLPRTLEQFILREQAEDLLRAPGVVAVEPGRMPYGAFGRDARRAPRDAHGRAARPGGWPARCPGRPAASSSSTRSSGRSRASCARAHRARSCGTGAGTATSRPTTPAPALRARLERAARARPPRRGADVRRVRGRWPSSSARPAATRRSSGCRPATSRRRDPSGTVVAISLGHLGWRTDWALLRAVAERLGDRLVLLLVGDVARGRGRRRRRTSAPAARTRASCGSAGAATRRPRG